VPHLPLIVNIGVALTLSLAGGLLARRLGLPTLVGYLLAGVAISPFSPLWVGDTDAIAQLAEVGVILLMFGIGLHFSFKDLWQVRDIAVPGAIIQMAVISILGFALASQWGFTTGGAWVFGIAVSVASTIVLLRGLMDNGWLDTTHGRVAVGWLVFEDLATVAILVLLPTVVGGAGGPWWVPVWAIAKAILFVVLMVFVGQRVVPAVLGRVVRTRSRELFVLVALTLAVGTALASSAVFGISLALGAFVAGVVVSESPFSHQISADLLPFREAFAVLFFVSVGMLVNPIYVVDHWKEVLILLVLIVVVKGGVSAAIGFALPYPARTALILGAGRGQVGEFSFIVGQAGLGLGLIDMQQYSLILAGAIGSITINPLMFRMVGPTERWLQQYPSIWKRLNRHGPAQPPATETLTGHAVIVGSGRVGRHINQVLTQLSVPRIVVENDPNRLDTLRRLGVPVLYGDAASSEIMEHARLDKAKLLVITLPDDVAALTVVMMARIRSSTLPIIARASTWDGARRLLEAGANDVIRPELEGGIAMVRRTLLDLDLNVNEIERYADEVRREGLGDAAAPGSERARLLDDLVRAARHVEIRWVTMEGTSPLAGHTLAESALRKKTGVSVVAIVRLGRVINNPDPDSRLEAGDRIALLGTPEQVEAVDQLFHPVMPG
jgi:CPA2 family monovalent cation:H+ antiporter-2